MIKTRNHIIDTLKEHLGIEVVISSQLEEEPASPYAYYTVINPQEIVTNYGNTEFVAVDDKKGYTVLREEALMTISFTFVSNGTTPNVHALDESWQYADKALQWFRHVGQHILEDENIILERFSSINSRTVIELNEESRRQGFDATFRYAVESSRDEAVVGTIALQSNFDKE